MQGEKKLKMELDGYCHRLLELEKDNVELKDKLNEVKWWVARHPLQDFVKELDEILKRKDNV
jgi:hypothetical protein